MNRYYKTLETAAKLPEFHLDHDCNYDELIKALESLNYKKYFDFKIICTRGYEMKEVIRLCKTKIKKDSRALEIIKDYLLTEEKYLNLTNDSHYPVIKQIAPQEL